MSREMTLVVGLVAAVFWLVGTAYIIRVYVKKVRTPIQLEAEEKYAKVKAWLEQLLGTELACDGNLLLLAMHQGWTAERIFDTGKAWHAYLRADRLLHGDWFRLWRPFWQIKEAFVLIHHALHDLRVQDVAWARVICVDEVEDGDVIAAVTRMRQQFERDRVLIRSEEFIDRTLFESKLFDAGFRVVLVPDGFTAIGVDDDDLCLVVANRRVILWTEARKS